MRFKKNVTYTKHCDWPVTNSLNEVRTLTNFTCKKSHTNCHDDFEDNFEKSSAPKWRHLGLWVRVDPVKVFFRVLRQPTYRTPKKPKLDIPLIDIVFLI